MKSVFADTIYFLALLNPAETLPREKEADELMAIMTTMIKRAKEKS